MEPAQQELLDRIIVDPLLTVTDLETAGVLPVDNAAQRPPPVAVASREQAQGLFDEAPGGS